MNLTPYFKSIIDQDVASVVICNLKHEIIYMNPKAVESYHKWGTAWKKSYELSQSEV